MTRLVVIIILVLSVFGLPAQKINRMNKKGERYGKWINYRDSAKTQKFFEGRFRRDKPVGKARYYNETGGTDRLEIMRFGRMKTKMYYPDGKLLMVGKAELVEDSVKFHYYFYGRWAYYNAEGQLSKYLYYEKGKLVKTVRTGKNFSTPLILTLERMEEGFLKKNDLLIRKINAAKNDAVKIENIQRQIVLNDAETFNRLDSILAKGYPGRELLDDKVYIPFYLLNYAPACHKEKYLPVLKPAADRGDIAWSSLAIYIDKIYVARGLPQLYGTQYYYEGKKQVQYPVADPERLNERKREIGLRID